MEKFRDLLELDINEGTEMTQAEFAESLEKNFKKHFPNGFIQVKTEKSSLGGEDYISGTFGMIGDLKDNSNGIAGNDKMKHGFIMWSLGDSGAWSFKVSGGAKIYINPAEGSYNAMDSIKTKMGNNSKITLSKADVKMAKFFKKLSGLMKDNVDNIFGVKDIKPKYLIFK